MGRRRNLLPAAGASNFVVTFILGILLMVGIGNYAPSLIIFSLLGTRDSS
jgi:hypothetical protein